MSNDNALLARLEELEALAYRPGAHVCTGCGFEFQTANDDGSRDLSGEIQACPKCDAMCRRMSEREYLHKVEARLKLASSGGKNLQQIIEHMTELLRAARPAVSAIADYTPNETQKQGFIRLREGIDIVLSAHELRSQAKRQRQGPDDV